MHQLPHGAKKVIRTGLPPADAGRVIGQIDLWLRCSGPEWTNQRLKAYQTSAIQLKAGNLDMAKSIYQENSISYNRGNLIPKGIMGVIVSGYVSSKKPASIRKFAALLRIYTCLRVDALTTAQKAKCYASINGSYTGKPDAFRSIFYKYGKAMRKNMRDPRGEDGKVLIDLSRFSPSSATHIEAMLDKPLSNNAWGKHVMSLWTSVWIPDSLKRINPAETLRSLLEQSGADSRVAGHIAFLQEGGCKARVVAVPNVWIQLLMEPLGRSLDRLGQHYSEIVVHDQNRGAYFCKEKMAAGEVIYCHDLSSATDRFPRYLQRALLEGLGYEEYSEAIEEISMAPWIANRDEWSYTVGQPMGMYCSFPLFNLSHFVLLKALQSVLRAQGRDMGDFRVLGDDVVITGKALSDLYVAALNTLGCTRSVPKCVISNSLAEFAGFQIHKTNRGTTAFRPFKYSGRQGSGAALHYINAFGVDGRYPGKYWREQAKLFSRTRGWRNPDLSPLFSMRLDDTDPKVNLNSHRLGSLSNQLSWFLGYEPLDAINDVYEEQQIILLGQKEIVKDGFASANDNIHLSPGKEPDDVLQDKPEPSRTESLSSDPLLNQIKGTGKPCERLNLFS